MTQPKTLGDLLPGDKVLIAKIEMTLEYYSGPNPVFVHEVDGKPYFFIDRSWTRDTKISAVK